MNQTKMMSQNKIMSASMMMSQEIDELTERFDEETKVLGRYDVNQNTHWREYNEQVIKCRVIQGKIDVLNKMMNQLSAMNMELPQLTNV